MPRHYLVSHGAFPVKNFPFEEFANTDDKLTWIREFVITNRVEGLVFRTKDGDKTSKTYFKEIEDTLVSRPREPNLSGRLALTEHLKLEIYFQCPDLLKPGLKTIEVVPMLYIFSPRGSYTEGYDARPVNSLWC